MDTPQEDDIWTDLASEDGSEDRGGGAKDKLMGSDEFHILAYQANIREFSSTQEMMQTLPLKIEETIWSNSEHFSRCSKERDRIFYFIQ